MVDSAGYLYLTCSTAGGKFGCSASSGANGFYYCPSIAPVDALVFGTVEGGRDNVGVCTVLGVTPVCI